jgi:UDP-N-acetylmuramoyl-L-alanyl-D-glutamate--2,6-diaminopimelate ligase
MEQVQNNRGIYVFVDYAHKPEALEKVLQALDGRRILTVFGCGGDRDRTKRPVMGEIATRLSHFVYLTSDNPRTENPMQILAEIEKGIVLKNYVVIADRAEAIKKAIHDAKPNDVVLIAGKGHEDYQIIGTEKRHFDDREEANRCLFSKSP